MVHGVLDPTDRQILHLLQRDARLSNKELAARVGLAPSSCLERVRRLVRKGILRGFHAAVAPPAVGVGLQLLIGFRLTEGGTMDAAMASLGALPELHRIWQLAGPVPLLAQGAFRDQEHVAAFLASPGLAAARVEPLETRLLLREHCDALPDLLAPAAAGRLREHGESAG